MRVLNTWLIICCTAIVALNKLSRKLFLSGFSASALPTAFNRTRRQEGEVRVEKRTGRISRVEIWPALFFSTSKSC